MLLGYKKSNLTVRSRKKSNQLEQNRDNFISLLNELNPYIRRASSRMVGAATTCPRYARCRWNNG